MKTRSADVPRLGVAVASGALAGWSVDAIAGALTAAEVQRIEIAVGKTGLLNVDDEGLAAHLQSRLADVGLEVCGVDATQDLAINNARAAAVLDLAAELYAPFVRYYAPVFDRNLSIEFQFERAANALYDLALRGKRQSIDVLIELAPGTIAPSPELGRRILDTAGFSGTGIVFDPGSMVTEGHLPHDLALALLGGTVSHVHVKNRALERQDGRWLPTSRTLADGLVDWPGTLQLLVDKGYTGLLSIDHLSGPASVNLLCSDVGELRSMIKVLSERSTVDLDVSQAR